jgi:tetratricopeptide (TPR) repeat protein
MAKEDIVENDEDFISLEEDDEEELLEPELEESELDETSTEPASKNKLLYILIAVFTILAFALLGFLFYLYLQKQETQKPKDQTETIIENIQEKKVAVVQGTSYQTRIQEAKRLFKEGKKEQALAIYDEISHYNQALSFYNIGVASLKKGDLDKAKEAFLKSITHEKLKFESALNIAITAFNQGDNKTFISYLTLATKELPSRRNVALYSYYQTLIDYYRGFYAEALIPLRHPTATYYKEEQDALLVKLYSAFDNTKEAIKVLEQSNQDSDFFTLGLLYANQEEYPLAQKYLLKATEKLKKPLAENLALALVYNKMGLYKKSADILNPTYANHKERATKLYPIEVSLKEALFDPVAAQKAFQKNLFFNDRNKFSLLFYFAPYRLVNPKQTIDSIHKGTENIFVHAYDPALNELQLSGKISDANIEITKGIKAALNKNLYKANEIFQEGLKKYPSSAPLHYNIALTYAKLYDFQNAYKYFKRSAVLDTNNLYAPMFAYLSAKLLLKEEDKATLMQLDTKIQARSNHPSYKALNTLLAIVNEDITQGDMHINQTPFEDTLALILAQMRQERTAYQESAQSLLKKIPDDIIANILSLDAYHDKQAIKTYAKAIQTKLTKTTLNFTPLYSGHAFVKELYIEMLNIAGLVPHAKNILENRLREVGANDIATLQALAYTDIYLKEFDQAYAIYNQLIDVQKQQDSNTLFLAAIASIGAHHHENAIALLELAKLTNKSNLESRYALGILYHESKNLEGAAIQYAKIGDDGFQSRYFSFQLAK